VCNNTLVQCVGPLGRVVSEESRQMVKTPHHGSIRYRCRTPPARLEKDDGLRLSSRCDRVTLVSRQHKHSECLKNLTADVGHLRQNTILLGPTTRNDRTSHYYCLMYTLHSVFHSCFSPCLGSSLEVCNFWLDLQK